MLVTIDATSVVKAGDLLHRRPDKALMSTSGESRMTFLIHSCTDYMDISGRTSMLYDYPRHESLYQTILTSLRALSWVHMLCRHGAPYKESSIHSLVT